MNAKAYTGTLKDNIGSSGGESTGWALTECPELAGGFIELVVDAVPHAATKHVGQPVIVTGEVFEAKLVESGVVKRLRAKSIEADPSQPRRTIAPPPPQEPRANRPRDGNPPRLPGPGPVPKPEAARSSFTGTLTTGTAQAGQITDEYTGFALTDCAELDRAAVRLIINNLSFKRDDLVGKRVVVGGTLRESVSVQADGKKITTRSIWVESIEAAK